MLSSILTVPCCPFRAFSHTLLQLHIVKGVSSTLIVTSARGQVSGTVVTCSEQNLYYFMLIYAKTDNSEDVLFDHAACNWHSAHVHNAN